LALRTELVGLWLEVRCALCRDWTYAGVGWETDADAVRLFGLVSVCSCGKLQLGPLERCCLRVMLVLRVDPFGQQRTVESELARTRGIRLSN
jgi:hypothetical protein